MVKKDHLVQILQYKNGKVFQYITMSSENDISNYIYRYVQLRILALTSGKCLQFSHLEFLNKYQQVFDYAKNCPLRSVSWQGSCRIIPEEPPKNAYTPYNYPEGNRSVNKVCIEDIYNPITLTFDLGTSCLNIKKFNTWRWRYSNDTASQTGRNMKSFELLVSNDNINWKSVDKQENVVYQTPYTDGKIAYTGNLKYN